LAPQSLADPSRGQVRQADSRSHRRSESVGQAADRLCDEAWIAWVRESVQLAEADPPIATPTRDVDRDQRPA
jgi:hypothetical protein